jgi:hypothetical protein
MLNPFRVQLGCSAGRVTNLSVSVAVTDVELSQSMASATRYINLAFVLVTMGDSTATGLLEPVPALHVLDICDFVDAKENATVSVAPRIGLTLEKS